MEQKTDKILPCVTEVIWRYVSNAPLALELQLLSDSKFWMPKGWNECFINRFRLDAVSSSQPKPPMDKLCDHQIKELENLNQLKDDFLSTRLSENISPHFDTATPPWVWLWEWLKLIIARYNECRYSDNATSCEATYRGANEVSKRFQIEKGFRWQNTWWSLGICQLFGCLIINDLSLVKSAVNQPKLSLPINVC
jgi:hypothetical protein